MTIIKFEFLKRVGVEYSAEDVQIMRKMAKADYSARETARRLGRTLGGLKYAAMSRGIHFRSIAQKRGTQSKPGQRRKLSRLAKARHAS